MAEEAPENGQGFIDHEAVCDDDDDEDDDEEVEVENQKDVDFIDKKVIFFILPHCFGIVLMYMNALCFSQ